MTNQTDAQNAIYTESEIRTILIDLGINPANKGYNYIIQAMNLIQSDRTYINAITGRLYPDIAKMNNATRDRVERCMRFAIQNSNMNTESDLYKTVFKNTTVSLTNTQFLAYLYEYFKIKRNIKTN